MFVKLDKKLLTVTIPPGGAKANGLPQRVMGLETDYAVLPATTSQ